MALACRQRLWAWHSTSTGRWPPRRERQNASDSRLTAGDAAFASTVIRLPRTAGAHFGCVSTGRCGGGVHGQTVRRVRTQSRTPFAAPGTSAAATACRPCLRAGGPTLSPPSGRCRAPACRPPCLLSQPYRMHALRRAVIRGASWGPLHSRACAGLIHRCLSDPVRGFLPRPTPGPVN